MDPTPRRIWLVPYDGYYEWATERFNADDPVYVLESELATVKAQRDELAAALRSLLDSLGALSNPTELHGWMTEAEQAELWQALATLEAGNDTDDV